MSNIDKASKNIKKKLSFTDYSEPVNLHTSIPAEQPAGIPAHQQDGMPIEQRNGKPASHHTSKTAHQHDSKLASQYAVMPVKQQTGKMAQRSSEDKIKSTYYLTNEADKSLTTVYIKRLQNNNKTDKSALICEAIDLLLKKEQTSL